MCVAAPLCRVTSNISGGVADNFLLHHVFDLLAGSGNGMCGTAIGSRRHYGNVAGQKNEEARRCGSRAIRPDPRNNRYRRGKNGFDDLPHGIYESTWRVQAQHHSTRANIFSMAEPIFHVSGTDGMHNIGKIDLNDLSRYWRLSASENNRAQRNKRQVA